MRMKKYEEKKEKGQENYEEKNNTQMTNDSKKTMKEKWGGKKIRKEIYRWYRYR